MCPSIVFVDRQFVLQELSMLKQRDIVQHRPPRSVGDAGVRRSTWTVPGPPFGDTCRARGGEISNSTRQECMASDASSCNAFHRRYYHEVTANHLGSVASVQEQSIPDSPPIFNS